MRCVSSMCCQRRLATDCNASHRPGKFVGGNHAGVSGQHQWLNACFFECICDKKCVWEAAGSVHLTYVCRVHHFSHPLCALCVCASISLQSISFDGTSMILIVWPLPSPPWPLPSTRNFTTRCSTICITHDCGARAGVWACCKLCKLPSELVLWK